MTVAVPGGGCLRIQGPVCYRAKGVAGTSQLQPGLFDSVGPASALARGVQKALSLSLLHPRNEETPLGFVSPEPGSLRPRAGDFEAATAACAGTMNLPPALLLGEIRCLYKPPSSPTAFFSFIYLRLPHLSPLRSR